MISMRHIRHMTVRENFMKGLLVLLLFFLPLSVLAQETAIEDASAPIGAAATEPGQGEAEGPPEIADPIEPWNRAVFAFNDKLYFWLLKPVAQGYGIVVPEWGRVRVRNAFENITMPVRFVNSLLQLKMQKAGIELVRFLMNSTVGFGGMFDVASQNPKLRGSDEDLGQTLGVYGIGDGFFIVWPVLGPSSLRDTFGLAGDSFLNPVNYITPVETAVALRSYERVNDTSLRIGEYEDLKESSIDPYIAVKDAYIEHRKSEVKE